MPKLTIDGIEVEVQDGLTVLQACEQIGIEIPRFCYHERLTIAGNCRMCLVEMERAPKPIASCAMPAGEGMVITTNSPAVKKMRQGVMELLLINHPLDCPICDQGGECDLQDQAVGYGMDRSRYTEEKRSVKDKTFGPLIRAMMTRCIHCTRCIRFSSEIAGVPELGATGRGEHMEVGTYIEKALTSELSGNMIDLCPVGALTSNPYAFNARPWELKKTESIDVMDAVGSAIRVDAKGPEVMRILPRLNEDVNEEWISDKTRFACDGLKRQRLDTPYVRRDGKLEPASWDEAFSAIADRVKGMDGSKFAAITGDMACAESMTALKDLTAALGSDNIDCRQDGAALDASCRGGYVFNTTIAGIEEADACLIIGSNTRKEAPIINARLRKRYLMGGFKAGMIGEAVDLTFKHEHLGAGTDTLSEIADGKHSFAKILKKAKKPMLILGQGALKRSDGTAVLAMARQIAEDNGMISDDWNGFNVLHTAAARVGGLDLGLVSGDVASILDGCGSGSIDVVYLLGADEIDMNRLGKAFVIYQGHHGDAGAHRADVVLPGAAYTEKNATYVNTEGRVQRGRLAVFPLGEAREDWTILRALSDVLGHKLPYDTLSEVRQRMVAINSVFDGDDEVTGGAWGEFGVKGKLDSSAFVSPISNFHMTDPISRASETMAQCIEALLGDNKGKTGTDG
ncbi:MAG: NADH-quinone oxidoreductase subunit G [Rhodospirillales bacterium]|nr:NADH-quinone oxidoreductase subunit G [Rhodospirillales bacterium]